MCAHVYITPFPPSLAGAQPSEAEVLTAAGPVPQQQLAFWLVTCAAVSAWESKLEVPSVVDLANQKLGELSFVRDAVRINHNYI